MVFGSGESENEHWYHHRTRTKKKLMCACIFLLTLVSLLAFANLIRVGAPKQKAVTIIRFVVGEIFILLARSLACLHALYCSHNFQGLHVNKTCGFSSRTSAEWMNEWVSGWMDVLWLQFNSQPNAIVDIYFTRICSDMCVRTRDVYRVVVCL